MGIIEIQCNDANILLLLLLSKYTSLDVDFTALLYLHSLNLKGVEKKRYNFYATNCAVLGASASKFSLNMSESWFALVSPTVLAIGFTVPAKYHINNPKRYCTNRL